jgi:protein-tyrosine phosphatase
MAHYGFNEVLPGLFVGSRFSLYQPYLARCQITHLLSVDNFRDFPLGYTTKSLDIQDEEDENILQYFDECISFMQDHRILVFCTAGRSRSATIVCAFLMKVHKMSFESALATIKQAREVRPNPGFIRQLQQWEEMNCELCALEKKTEWFIEHKDWLVIRCEQCDLPMAVLRHHSMNTSGYIREQMVTALGIVADMDLAAGWRIDMKQRTIFTHLHWHARPALFKL